MAPEDKLPEEAARVICEIWDLTDYLAGALRRRDAHAARRYLAALEASARGGLEMPAVAEMAETAISVVKAAKAAINELE